MVKLLWVFGLRPFQSIWEYLRFFVVNFWHNVRNTSLKGSYFSFKFLRVLLCRNRHYRIRIITIHGIPKKFLFIQRIRSISIYQCYQLFIRLRKLMTDQKEIWNRLKPQKMNIPLGVFPFKLSKDQKDIMIWLG